MPPLELAAKVIHAIVAQGVAGVLREAPTDRITIETEDGIVLEGELRLPDEAPRGHAVICHPHPQFGGSKDHPLLWAIRNELAARGLSVLSFNFRGVMGSGGHFGGGIDEVKDVRAAVDRADADGTGAVFVCGWSFGAHTALREALDDERVGKLALIGFPLRDTDDSRPDPPERARLRAFDRPVLLVAGEADPFCPIPELRSLGRQLARARVEVLPGTDHFFWKREREVARIVGSFAEGEPS
jgi:uncharacterized protein